MPAQVIVKGGPQTAAALEGMKGDLRDMTPVHREVADVMARAISSAAPRLSGTLAGSIEGKGESDRAEAGSDLVYAPVIENGWPAHNIAAQHYAEQAIERATPTIESTYRAGVEKMIRKAEG